MMTNKIKWQEEVQNIFIQTQGRLNATKIFNSIKDNPNVQQVPTHHNTVQKYVAKNRDTWMKVVDEGLEKPWHWGALLEYNLSYEACLLIDQTMEGIERAIENIKSGQDSGSQSPLSIREALWIARLGWLMKKEEWEKGKDYEWKLRVLYSWACAYATHEILQKLKPSENFETLLLDQGLRENFIPIPTTENSTMLFDLSRGFMHIDTPDRKIPKKLKIEVDKDSQ
jgi:hypothetical protein